MDLLGELDKICKFCNLKDCRCTSLVEKNRKIASLSEKMVKKRKWVTSVEGRIAKEDFVTIKQKLGTGGKWYPEMVQFRGKVMVRVQQMLERMGYSC